MSTPISPFRHKCFNHRRSHECYIQHYEFKTHVLKREPISPSQGILKWKYQSTKIWLLCSCRLVLVWSSSYLICFSYYFWSKSLHEVIFWWIPYNVHISLELHMISQIFKYWANNCLGRDWNIENNEMCLIISRVYTYLGIFVKYTQYYKPYILTGQLS